MQMKQPSFIDSEFFVQEAGNWHLLAGAPDDVREEFDAFMKNLNQFSEGLI